MQSAGTPQPSNGIRPGPGYSARRHPRCFHRHGLLLSAYHYRVCRFGGRFSGFWWQRAGFLQFLNAILKGVFLLRQIYGLLVWKPHKAFLFVDDLLCALICESAQEMFALVVLFFCAIAAPMSWKKAQFQDRLVWCGWEINFSAAPWVLAYADLNSPPGSMRSIQRHRAHGAFRACLNRDVKTSRSLPCLWVTEGSQVLEINGQAVHCVQDVARIPGTSKPTWV